jgi:phospholipid-transporting ATPase
MVFGMTVVISNLKILIVSNTHSMLSLLVITISLLIYLLSLGVLSEIQVSEFYLLFNRMFTTPNFHLGNLLIIATTVFVDYAITLFTSKNRT